MLRHVFPLRSPDDLQLRRIRKYPWIHVHNGTTYYPSRADLIRTIYRFDSVSNPYANVQPFSNDEMKLVRSYPSSAVEAADQIEAFILQKHGSLPQCMVEVGSFVGSSTANVWGPFAKRKGGLVLSVDTWQGDSILRLNPWAKRFMNVTGGLPGVYHIFMRHMATAGLADTVYPLAMAATAGARLLDIMKWKFDVVYVDTAHEQGDTLIEIHYYYELLRPGGLLLGDDYDLFPSVKHDVDLFAQCVNASVLLMGKRKNIWSITKP